MNCQRGGTDQAVYAYAPALLPGLLAAEAMPADIRELALKRVG